MNNCSKNTNSIPKSKVSVIIPCYNVEQWIDRCLISVTDQTYGIENIEIICIDDHSSDNTVSKLMEWESKYPENIMVIPLENNGRQGRARNIGLQYSTGEWIAFIDSDDWVEPDYIERMYECIGDKDIDIVECRSVRDSSTSTEPARLSNAERNIDAASREMIIDTDSKRELFIFLQPVTYTAWGKLIRKDFIIDNNLFFLEGVTYEDTSWGCFANIYTSKLYILEQRLYHYFVNDSSTVLKKDAPYHKDLLLVQEDKFNRLLNSGLFDKYSEALTFEHIMSYYLSFLKILALRYDNPPYDLFIRCKENTVSQLGECRNNRYIQEGLHDFHKVLLDTLYLNIDKNEFVNILVAIRKHGGL